MRRIVAALLVLVAASLVALDVDEEELQELGTQDIDFINYDGPYEQIDSVEAIVGIGRALGNETADGATDFTLNGRYRIIRAVSSDGEGLDADIFVPLASSRIDHIDNMRRIISGFLQSAYSYSEADADLLARWITIYNAVGRGSIEFFEERYKPVVMQHLSEENAGLSRRYDEWPGMSRVVIPLSEDAADGTLGSVDPGELGDDQVVEELRSQEDRGIEDRQDMVDLTERVIEEQEEAQAEEAESIADEQARIDREEAEIEQERDAIAEEREQVADLPEDERAAAEQDLADREQAADERQSQADADRQAVEERQEDLVQDQQETAELTERVREERERIASDTRALLDERDIADEVRGVDGDLSPVYFLQVRESEGVVLGQLVQINPITGLLVNRSAEDAIVSRSYTFAESDLLAVVADDGVGRLARFDVATLEENLRAEEALFLQSVIELTTDPERIYAVVEDGGQHFLGRFGTDLAFIDRSVIAVNPYTTIAFGGNKVFVQTDDNRIVGLSLDDLRIAP
jgi:hypothetical protein